ncbi:MAG: histidine kinase [Eubacteriales bacterium]|nr:histidine kinase [Eubacteriales bacterium]
MKLFHMIRKFFGNLKIRTKLFLLILLAVSIPMLVVSFLLSNSLRQMITSDTLRNEQLSTAKTAPYLRTALNQVISVENSVTATAFSDRIFNATLSEDIDQALTGSDLQTFVSECRSIMTDTPVTAVRFYVDLPREHSFFAEADTIFAPLSSVSTSYWYGIFHSTRPTRLFCPPLYLTPQEKENYGDCAYIRPLFIRDKTGSSIQVYEVYYFNSDSLAAIMQNNLSQAESVSYIANDRNAIVVNTNQARASIYYMPYDSIRSNLMSSNGFLEREILGEEVYVSSHYLPEAEWFLVTVTPSAPLVARSQRILWSIILIWVGSALLSILISVFLSRSISSRLHRISQQMTLVRNAPPVPMPDPEETDEIGELTDSYNYMAQQINLLIEEQKKASEELRVAEFKSLQAQINPHFLYNTMEMINWMAQQGRTKETNQAIRDLSRFYKLTLSRKDSISTIEEEIEHITIYTRLQNMRFDDGIDFVVDVPDSLLECRIPRLTLQPVIENSILHGILEKESHRGTIVLTGWQEDDTAVLLLSDDGIGIAPDILPKILTGTLENTGKGNHIAVYNTHRRLQILYGPNYGLHYRSTPGEGTEVEIRLPYSPINNV